MKKTGYLLKRRLMVRRRLGRYRAVGECLLLAGGGFLFSGAQIMGQALPLAACLGAVQPFGWNALSAAAGAAAGYLLRIGGAQGAELTALTVLMLAAVTVFQGTRLPASFWFMPLMSGAVTAILGAVTLVGGSFDPAALCWWGAKSLMAAVMTVGVRENGTPAGRLLLWAGAAAGLAALPWNLGLLPGAVLLAWWGDLPLLAAVGLAVDLHSGTPCALPALLSAGLCCRFLPQEAAFLRGAVCLVLPCAVSGIFGALSAAQLFCVAVGVPVGLLLHRYRPLPHSSAQLQERSGQRLRHAAQVMETLGRQLPEAAQALPQSETDSMFDGAAERVCRCCPRFHRCWRQQAAVTYKVLTGAADRILERGVARAEDFSLDCCHLEGFVTAINQELEGVLYRRRYQAQLTESRRIMGESFACMADYLRAEPNAGATAVFRPVFGISSAGRYGNSANGDRGACFPGVSGEYFILLCDGMGTGEAAADIGAETVQMLRELLTAGVDCGSALRLLNGTYLLRDSGCFATVDLVRLDLCSGTAKLYKWGSAPSYLRQNGEVRRLGRPAPPPGLRPGRCYEEFDLDLKGETLLVLVSDGADDENTLSEITAFSGDTPRELAALLIAGVSPEDDRTAVVIGLRP